MAEIRPGCGGDRCLFWAAMNLGGVFVAVAMIDRLRTEDGLAQLRDALSVEPYDVLEAIAVGLAARSAVSAVDLCASAAWRFRHQGQSDRNGKEKTLKWVRCGTRLYRLAPLHAAWVRQVDDSLDWQLLEPCRHQAVHRTFRRTVKTPRRPSDFEVEGSKYAVDELLRCAAQSEKWFRDFCQIPLPSSDIGC